MLVETEKSIALEAPAREGLFALSEKTPFDLYNCLAP